MLDSLNDSVSSNAVTTTFSPSNSPLGAKILFPTLDVAKEDTPSLTARVETLENQVSAINLKLDHVMSQLDRLMSALPLSPPVPEVDSTLPERPNVLSTLTETNPLVRKAWTGHNSQIKAAPSVSVPPRTPNATPSINISDSQPRPLNTHQRRATSPVLNPSRAAEGEPKTSIPQDRRLSHRSSISTCK